jgi:hypothetical protein
MHTTKTCVRRNVERKILVLFRTTVLGVLWRLAGGVSTAKSLYPMDFFLFWNLKFDDSSDIYFPPRCCIWALVRWFHGTLKNDKRSADISYQCIAVNSEQILHFRKEYPRTTQAGTPSYDLVYDLIEL